MGIDEKVSAGVRNISDAYELQDRLLRELYELTQNLHERTRLALEFSGGRDAEVFERLLRRHEALGAAIREFFESKERKQ